MRPATCQTSSSPFVIAACLSNFLDWFYAAPAAAALEAEPSLLAPTSGETGRLPDASLPATAEALAGQFGFPPPRSTAGESRVLHGAWFAAPLTAVGTGLLRESPPSFRARHLFVSANALSRKNPRLTDPALTAPRR